MMRSCFICGLQCKGIYKDDNENIICSRCVSKKERRQRSKNKLTCSKCGSNCLSTDMICSICKRAEEYREGRKCCDGCNHILRHKNDGIDKCMACLSHNTYLSLKWSIKSKN